MNTSSSLFRRLVCPAVLVLATGSAALLPVAQAQLAPPAPPVTAQDATDFNAASALFNQKKWPDAMAALEAFRNKYGKNSPQSIPAKYMLAVVYIQVKSYDDAARELRQLLVDPKMDPTGKEEVQLLIAKALTLKGAGLPADTLVQKGAQTKAFQEAITEYDKFLADYPKSKSGDSAHFLRASLLLAIENYDQAVNGFVNVVSKFPQSPLRYPSQMNIGKARMNQAYALLATKDSKEPSPKDVADAMTIFRDFALPALEEVYLKSNDLAIMNEAVYFMGQIRLTQHQNAPATDDPAEKKRLDALLLSSLDAFRAVRSREEVVAAQEQKIDGYKKQIELLDPRQVETYQGAKKAYERVIEIEEDKKKKFLDEQDQFLGARLAIAQIFLIEKKYDECRVLIRYLQGQKELLEKEKDARANLGRILATTYIEQKNVPKALEAWEAFRKEFNTKPGEGNLSGDSVPLLLAQLIIENPTEANIAKATEILTQARTDYKPWRYEAQSLQVQVGILNGQEKFAEALVLVDQILGGAPKPEVEVEMLVLKANILRAMASKLGQPANAAEALRTYKVVRDKFPGTARAEDAWFESATVQEGLDAAAAGKEFQAFIDKFKDGGGKSKDTLKNVGLAQFHLARILQGQPKKGDEAIAAYRQLAEKYPENEAAPMAFFKIFDIQSERKDYAAAAKTMDEFLQKYPTHEYVYYAYNNQAEILFSGQLSPKKGPAAGPASDADLEAGTKKLMDYVDYELAKDLKEKVGAKSLLKISDRWKKTVPNLPYFSLNNAQKLTWQKAMENMETANERVLKSYISKDEEVLKALTNLVFVNKERVKAKVIELPRAETYFNKLLTDYGTTPDLKSKILFAYGDFFQDFDPKKAGEFRQNSIDAAAKAKGGEPGKPAGDAGNPAVAAEGPKPSLLPSQYDVYLQGLFEQKKYDEMAPQIAKMRSEYALQKDELPAKAPKLVQDAQAIALFWEGKILGAQNKTTDAGGKFKQLATDYPNSPKGGEADYGIILGNMDMSPPVLQDDYIERLTSVVKKSDTKRSFELPAKAVFLSGRIFEAKKQYEDAIASYRTVAVLYKSVPSVAAEALWRAAQILKKQASGEIPVKIQRELREERAAHQKALAEKSAKELAEKKAKDEADKKKPETKPGAAKPAETKGETKAAEPAKTPEGTPAKTDAAQK